MLLDELEIVMSAFVAYLFLASCLIGGMLLLALAVILIQGKPEKSSYQLAEENRNEKRKFN